MTTKAYDPDRVQRLVKDLQKARAEIRQLEQQITAARNGSDSYWHGYEDGFGDGYRAAQQESERCS